MTNHTINPTSPQTFRLGLKVSFISIFRRAHTRENKKRRELNTWDSIHRVAFGPFVMLIGQITRHHSKLNTWLITLKPYSKMFSVCRCQNRFSSEYRFCRSSFSVGLLDWQAWVQSKSDYVRRDANRMLARMVCFAAFCSFIANKTFARRAAAKSADLSIIKWIDLITENSFSDF